MAPSFNAQEHGWLRAAKRKFEQRDLGDKTLDQRKDLFIEDLMNLFDPPVQKLIDKIDEMSTDEFWALYKTL
jgi:hypothetical protein